MQSQEEKNIIKDIRQALSIQSIADAEEIFLDLYNGHVSMTGMG